MSRHAKSLASAVSLLKPYTKYIRSIYLYGSCARCEQKPDSDIDLFLFMEQGTTPTTMREIRSVLSSEDLIPEVDVHFSTTDEFSGVKSFNARLDKEAKLLWEKRKHI